MKELLAYTCVLLTVTLLNFGNCAVQEEQINSKITIDNVDRIVDLSTQVAKILNKITIKNEGSSSVNSILFSTEETKSDPAYISALVGTPKTNLKIQEVKAQGHSGKKFWKITLDKALASGKTLNIEVNEFWTNKVKPYPEYISQKDKQLVRFHGNAYMYSPYKINKITTKVTLTTKKVEDYSKIKPTNLVDNTITYGAYSNVAPFTQNPMVIHYENNAPFLLIKNLERTLEVSHWGNIAVEETIELLHIGAKLKGSFSRYEFQRESGRDQPSVQSFKMMLPAAAFDAYYRDDIGNISTSNMKMMKDAVELELRPRFPLFGGWQTRYVIGYNVPSYEYLFNSGSDYLLKMRIIDHVFDDMVVEKCTTKIILPEGVDNINLKTPYPVERLTDSLHHTYLDTKGRTVIILRKENLIESHIQDFKLSYSFSRILMLQEPLLVSVALYALFLVVIAYVRFDFAISKKVEEKTK